MVVLYLVIGATILLGTLLAHQSDNDTLPAEGGGSFGSLMGGFAVVAFIAIVILLILAETMER